MLIGLCELSCISLSSKPRDKNKVCKDKQSKEARVNLSSVNILLSDREHNLIDSNVTRVRITDNGFALLQKELSECPILSRPSHTRSDGYLIFREGILSLSLLQ